MGTPRYRVVASGITDTSQAPRGKDIYYLCKRCGQMIPSQPADNVGCVCGNIFIDVDYLRLAICDYSMCRAVRET